MQPLTLDFTPVFPATIGNVTIISATTTTVVVAGDQTGLFSSPNFIYILNNTYYLKFNATQYNSGNNTTTLSFVRWANDAVLPPGTYSVKYTFYESVPVHGRYLCTLSDSNLIYQHGSYSRQLLKEAGLTYDFIGEFIDPYGFRHNAVSGMTTKLFLETKLPKIPVADSYYILMGTNDESLSLPPEQTITNLLSIINYIKTKFPESIVYLSTLQLTMNPYWNRQINARLRQLDLPAGVVLVDLEANMPTYSTWVTYLTDGTHVNQTGYELMAAYLATALE